jgi:hypothetical protein
MIYVCIKGIVAAHYTYPNQTVLNICNILIKNMLLILFYKITMINILWPENEFPWLSSDPW